MKLRANGTSVNSSRNNCSTEKLYDCERSMWPSWRTQPQTCSKHKHLNSYYFISVPKSFCALVSGDVVVCSCMSPLDSVVSKCAMAPGTERLLCRASSTMCRCCGVDEHIEGVESVGRNAENDNNEPLNARSSFAVVASLFIMALCGDCGSLRLKESTLRQFSACSNVPLISISVDLLLVQLWRCLH